MNEQLVLEFVKKFSQQYIEALLADVKEAHQSYDVIKGDLQEMGLPPTDQEDLAQKSFLSDIAAISPDRGVRNNEIITVAIREMCGAGLNEEEIREVRRRVAFFIQNNVMRYVREIFQRPKE